MEIHSNHLINIFLDLVKLDAVSKQERPVADYIHRFLSDLNIPTREDHTAKKIAGSSGNVIAKISSSGHSGPAQFSLTAHMDTIQSTRGIRPQVMNGKITSDGQTILGADNRAGIAMILYLIRNIRRQNLPHLPFEVIFTVGEETGLYGSTHLDLSMVESRTAYILDSSADPGAFVYAAPGATEFTISFTGKASHAAVNPEQGINALSMAGDLIHQFKVGKVTDDTTINFGKISGGEANNIVPARVTLYGEIRSFSKTAIDQNLDKMEKMISEITRKNGGKYEISREEAFPGFELDRESGAIQRLIASLRAVKLDPQPLRYHGGSDANILNNRGMTAIDMGIGAKNPHSPEEYILLKDMLAVEKLIHHLVMPENGSSTVPGSQKY